MLIEERFVGGPVRVTRRNRRRGLGVFMPITNETMILLRTAAICAVAALLIAKIWRECAADVLRNKLRLIEIELFDLVRRGHLSASDLEYRVLMHGVRTIARNANRYTITRFLAACAVGRGRSFLGLAELQRRQWLAARGGVLDANARERVAALANRMCLEVRMVTLLGPAALAVQPGADAVVEALRGIRLLFGRVTRVAPPRARRAESASAAA